MFGPTGQLRFLFSSLVIALFLFGIAMTVLVEVPIQERATLGRDIENNRFFLATFVMTLPFALIAAFIGWGRSKDAALPAWFSSLYTLLLVSATVIGAGLAAKAAPDSEIFFDLVFNPWGVVPYFLEKHPVNGGLGLTIGIVLAIQWLVLLIMPHREPNGRSDYSGFRDALDDPHEFAQHARDILAKNNANDGGGKPSPAPSAAWPTEARAQPSAPTARTSTPSFGKRNPRAV